MPNPRGEPLRRRAAVLNKRLAKKARRGFRGYPVGTLACYGPDDRRASKLVAAIVVEEGREPTELRKWLSEQDDVRDSLEIVEQVTAYFEQFGVRSVVMADGIIGCPHQEGIDYQGPVCPDCPFWVGRDRWTGEPTG